MNDKATEKSSTEYYSTRLNSILNSCQRLTNFHFSSSDYTSRCREVEFSVTHCQSTLLTNRRVFSTFFHSPSVPVWWTHSFLLNRDDFSWRNWTDSIEEKESGKCHFQLRRERRRRHSIDILLPTWNLFTIWNMSHWSRLRIDLPLIIWSFHCFNEWSILKNWHSLWPSSEWIRILLMVCNCILWRDSSIYAAKEQIALEHRENKSQEAEWSRSLVQRRDSAQFHRRRIWICRFTRRYLCKVVLSNECELSL